MREFLDVSRLLLADPDSGLDPEEKDLFRRVFDFRKEVAQAREKFRIDLDDIEQLFGLVEMSHRLDRNSVATRDATVYLIAKTLQLAIQRNQRRPWIRLTSHHDYRTVNLPWHSVVPVEPQSSNIFHCDMYNHFALLLSGIYDDPHKSVSRSNVVISFNYDLVLDDALRSIHVAPSYGLPNAVIEDQIASECARSISLLKLHGSTNWAICKNEGCDALHILDNKFTEDPRAFRTKPCAKCGRSGLGLLLVPPSWDKSEHHGVIQPVWRSAVEALNKANRICIIGYSMPETDSFFKFLLALGLAENQQLYKFVVVDLSPIAGPPFGRPEGEPQKQTIEERYRQMLETLFVERRFEFHNRGFAEFLTSGNTALGRAETITTVGRK